jgi:DnaJ-class molecular chaperone
MIAYKILGLDVCDDDEVIRQAYIEKLKNYPPEKEPEAYQTIYMAYEKINTHQKRLEYFLYENDADISLEAYGNTMFEVDKPINREKWDKICQIYQNRK